MRAEATSVGVRVRRRRTSTRRRLLQRSIAVLVVLAVAGLALGVAFAGSPTKLASGVHIAGVDVGGLTPAAARERLEQRSQRLYEHAILFTAGSQSWRISPKRLGLEVNWGAAVETARREGDGFAPVRGLRRIGMRVFGADITPRARVYEAALDYQLRLIARAVDRPHRDAAVKLRGLRPAVVREQAGRVLDRRAAESTIVRALTVHRRSRVALPVRADPPRVTATDLSPAVDKVRTALSAPVRMALGETRWKIPRWRIAGLLELPANGSRAVRIDGPYADRFFGRFARRVGHPPRNADFAVTASGGIRVVPAQDGLAVDLAATKGAVLAAALSTTNRTAPVTVERAAPQRSTAAARAMGITGLVGGYTTIYGGEPNRIHNVQLVSALIDRTLIPPGATFSFNQTTGERTEDKGFREAPVIINGELQTGLGGGVCQVSTTVFNAAYEAGLRITARTNHALYISHYPLARDATVNYPDIDLRFVNDTPKWLLLRTFVGASSLTVNLYGRPVKRRVVSEASPLATTGSIPVKRIFDSSIYVGETAIEESGSPPRSTSVRRLVYGPSGKLLHRDFWTSYYRGEPTVIRVGTKPKPAPPPPPKEKKPPTGTTPEEGGTPPASTTPTPTTPAPPAPPAPGSAP